MRLLAFFAVLSCALSLVSCHHTAATSTAITCTTTTTSGASSSSFASCTDPVTGITVTVSPASISLNVVTSMIFTGTVNGGTNNTIKWKVNGIPNGSPTVGTIDSNGRYTAPDTVPTPATVNVTAVSFEDPNLSAMSATTILPPPVVTITQPSPLTNLTVSSGSSSANTIAFAATVTGAATTDVDWLVNGVNGGDPTLGFGTITATGVYTAPLTPPVGSIVTVTAASHDFPQSFANAMVTISGFSISSLQGHFAFSISETNASGTLVRAGSFVADGAGNLTNGQEDTNSASGPTPISFTGSYSIAPDGRGTLQFVDGMGPAPTNASNFHFVLVNGTQLEIIGSDSGETASGQANAQDLTAFKDVALANTFVFDFTGTHGASSLSQIGEFTTDGAGHITSGSVDVNDGGATGTFSILNTSTYSVAPTGRGILSLATSDNTFSTMTFSFYVVSRGSAKFVGTDTTQFLSGEVFQQDPNASFNPTSLSGNYAFLLAGSEAGAPIATAGSFAADGSGNISSGVLDENQNGTASTDVPFVNNGTNAGTYTVGANGRGTLTFTTTSRIYSIVFYLIAQGNAVLQETDPGITSDGNFALQQSVAFSLTSVQGNYAIASSGRSGASAEVFLGQMQADGMGQVPSGTAPPSAIDVNLAGTVATGEAISGTYATNSSAERGTLTLNPASDNRNFALYVVSPTQAFVLGIDLLPPPRLAAGELLRRF